MAITPTRYASAEEYRAVFGSSDTETENARVEAALDAVCRVIDSECRRFFGKDSAPVARVFVPTRTSSTLYVGDMADVPTSVRIDSDQDGIFDEDITGFEAAPLEAAYGPEPRPYYEVHLPQWASRTTFVAGQRVEVTVPWGWPDVPPAMKRESIELAGMLLMHSPRTTSRFDEAIGAFVSQSKEARGLIARLQDQYLLREAY